MNTFAAKLTRRSNTAIPNTYLLTYLLTYYIWPYEELHMNKNRNRKLIAWHYQTNVGDKSASISGTVRDIRTKHQTANMLERAYWICHKNPKCRQLPYWIFKKMLTFLDFLKIFPPNMLGRFTAATRKWSRGQQSKPKVNPVRRKLVTKVRRFLEYKNAAGASPIMPCCCVLLSLWFVLCTCFFVLKRCIQLVQ